MDDTTVDPSHPNVSAGETDDARNGSFQSIAADLERLLAPGTTPSESLQVIVARAIKAVEDRIVAWSPGGEFYGRVVSKEPRLIHAMHTLRDDLRSLLSEAEVPNFSLPASRSSLEGLAQALRSTAAEELDLFFEFRRVTPGRD